MTAPRWPDRSPADEAEGRFGRWFPGGFRDAFLWFAIPVLALVIIHGGLASFRADLAAHDGLGVQGTFTATSERCSKSDCTWSGTFRARDEVLRGVSYNEGHANLSLGQQIPALDVGAAGWVYPSDGGWHWWLDPALMVVAVVGFGFWVRWTVKIRRRGRPSPDTVEER